MNIESPIASVGADPPPMPLVKKKIARIGLPFADEQQPDLARGPVGGVDPIEEFLGERFTPADRLQIDVGAGRGALEGRAEGRQVAPDDRNVTRLFFELATHALERRLFESGLALSAIRLWNLNPK